MQIVVSLVVVYSLAASAYLGVASARAILMAVGLRPPSLFATPYRCFVAAEPHLMDPRVPEGIRNRVLVSRLLAAVAFLVAGNWIFWRGDGGVGGLMIGLGVLTLGSAAQTYRRLRP